MCHGVWDTFPPFEDVVVYCCGELRMVERVCVLEVFVYVDAIVGSVANGLSRMRCCCLWMVYEWVTILHGLCWCWTVVKPPMPAGRVNRCVRWCDIQFCGGDLCCLVLGVSISIDRCRWSWWCHQYRAQY